MSLRSVIPHVAILLAGLGAGRVLAQGQAADLSQKPNAEMKVIKGWVPLVAIVPADTDMPWPSAIFRAMVSMRYPSSVG